LLSRFLPASLCPRLCAARQRSLLAGPIGAVRSISPGRGVRPLHGCPLFVFDDGTGGVRDHACSLLHLVSLRRDYIETPAGKREISPAISDGQPEKSGIALLNRHRCFLPPHSFGLSRMPVDGRHRQRNFIPSRSIAREGSLPCASKTSSISDKT